MKFRYEKTASLEHPDCFIHAWSLIPENPEFPEEEFTILASTRGVRFTADTNYYQPVDEEMKIPDDVMRALMTKIADAFEYAWKEQQRMKKNQLGRSALLEK